MPPEIAIIGGGPAGMAAALQLKRYDLECCLFERGELGGLMRNARRIENYPGFFPGIPGMKLAGNFKDHLAAFNVNVRFKPIILLDWNETENKFFLSTSDRLQHSADVVVMASGTKPKIIDWFTALDSNLKKRIFFEIFPLFPEKNKKILVVGAGDAAFDYALNLSNRNDIFIFNRHEQIKALSLLEDELRKNAGIRYFGNTMIKEIKAGTEAAIKIEFQQDGISKNLEVDYLVCAIGRIPQKDFYSSDMVHKEKKLVSSGLLYLAGDVKNRGFRQISIATSDGIKAAIKIYKKWGSL